MIVVRVPGIFLVFKAGKVAVYEVMERLYLDLEGVYLLYTVQLFFWTFPSVFSAVDNVVRMNGCVKEVNKLSFMVLASRFD